MKKYIAEEFVDEKVGTICYQYSLIKNNIEYRVQVMKEDKCKFVVRIILESTDSPLSHIKSGEIFCEYKVNIKTKKNVKSFDITKKINLEFRKAVEEFLKDDDSVIFYFDIICKEVLDRFGLKS